MTVPCPAFLIRHPSAGAILVDTGLHPSIATDGRENFGALGARIGKPGPRAGRRRPRAAAQARARARRGPDRGDDPPAPRPQPRRSPSSRRRPSSSARSSGTRRRAGRNPLLNGYRRAHYDYAFDYRTVDFDRGGVDSYASFGRTYDLFGDGSIRLAFTPGPQRRAHVAWSAASSSATS